MSDFKLEAVLPGNAAHHHHHQLIQIIIFNISIVTNMITTKTIQIITLTNIFSRDSTTKGLG